MLNNHIIDISALASLTKLTDLHLWNNQINDISPLVNLPDLRRVGVVLGNPVDDWSRNTLVPQLKERGVEVH